MAQAQQMAAYPWQVKIEIQNRIAAIVAKAGDKAKQPAIHTVETLHKPSLYAFPKGKLRRTIREMKVYRCQVGKDFAAIYAGIPERFEESIFHFHIRELDGNI